MTAALFACSPLICIKASLVRVSNTPILKAHKVLKKGKETLETRYYISSLGDLTAQALNDIARSHWGIENQLHWRLDVVFNEDKACIRNDNAAENINILRKWALNALAQAKPKPEQSIKSLMRKNILSFKPLLSSVNKILHA